MSLPVSRQPFAIVPLLVLLAVAAGCLGCDGESYPPTSGAASALRLTFPDQAAKVLEQDHTFVAAGEEFVLRAAMNDDTWRGLRAELPRDGRGAIHLRTMGGFEARVRALGMTDEGALAERAVAYRRTGGISFWTAVAGGVEEWLHLDAGFARGGTVATWVVDGGSVRQRGDAVEVVDERGVAQIRVSAPIAYASGGREVKARLEGQGPRITLSVDGGGDAVLVDPEWVSVNPMAVGRYGHTATRLDGGRVLVAGGYDAGVALASAEVYDPGSDTWTFTPGTMSVPRAGHTATPLGNGTVLVTGGYNGTYLDTAEIYSEASNTWTLSPSTMNSARGYHTATRLSDGRVLVAGGADNGAVLSTAELYDPMVQSWTSIVPMDTPRNVHTATRLDDGTVLVTGGADDMGAVLDSAARFDPSDESWMLVGPMDVPREYHTATLLDTGDVLVVGGDDGASVLESAELYDGSNWTSVMPLDTPREAHTATLLDSGEVLVTGGLDAAFAALTSAELYAPPINGWMPSTSTMSTARAQHTATPIAGGAVLVTGGLNNAFAALASAELYVYKEPAGSPCTTPDDCQSGACIDNICVLLPGSPCKSTDICPNGICLNNICVVVAGAPCDPEDPCQIGVCTNGICCNVPCTEDCKSCKLVDKAPNQGPDGVCGFRPQGHAVAEQCVDSVAVTAECDGAGNLIPINLNDCGNFACKDGACLDTCTTTTDCSDQAFCNDDGACAPKGEEGDACDAPDQCTSGYCIGDVCAADPGCIGGCGVKACRNGMCVDSCQSIEDCAAGYVCLPSGVCVPPTQVDLGEDSLACTAPGARGPGAPWALLVIGAGVAAARRRSRALRAR
jgi:Galactose oxidase, central domain/Kelch motif